MLFSAKFSDLEKRKGSSGDYFIAHSSKFDKTGILIFPPKDAKLSELLDKLCLTENHERLGDYDFKITYSTYKGQDGSFKTFFNLIGVSAIGSAD